MDALHCMAAGSVSGRLAGHGHGAERHFLCQPIQHVVYSEKVDIEKDHGQKIDRQEIDCQKAGGEQARSQVHGKEEGFLLEVEEACHGAAEEKAVG